MHPRNTPHLGLYDQRFKSYGPRKFDVSNAFLGKNKRQKSSSSALQDRRLPSYSQKRRRDRPKPIVDVAVGFVGSRACETTPNTGHLGRFAKHRPSGRFDAGRVGSTLIFTIFHRKPIFYRRNLFFLRRLRSRRRARRFDTKRVVSTSSGSGDMKKPSPGGAAPPPLKRGSEKITTLRTAVSWEPTHRSRRSSTRTGPERHRSGWACSEPCLSNRFVPSWLRKK